MADAKGNRQHHDNEHRRSNPSPRRIHGACVGIVGWVAPHWIVAVVVIWIARSQPRERSARQRRRNLRAEVTYPVGFDPVALVASDFNDDGVPDLAIDNWISESVSVLLGRGNGTFIDPNQYATTPRATPLLADANGDGTDDVVVLNAAGDILFRQGIPGAAGSFLPLKPSIQAFRRAISPSSPPHKGPSSPASTPVTPKSRYSLRHDGGFIKIGTLTTGQLPAQIISADLNGDGSDDLVVRNAGDGTISVYFSAGDPNVPIPSLVGPKNTAEVLFGLSLTISVGLGVSDIDAFDTTGNGRLDLVVTNKLTGQVTVLRNLGGGRFGPLGAAIAQAPEYRRSTPAPARRSSPAPRRPRLSRPARSRPVPRPIS